MLHIIQENVFREEHYDDIIYAIDRLGLDYKIVRVYPYIDKAVEVKDIPDNYLGDIDDLPDVSIGDAEKVWCWGSLKISRYAKIRGWTPGVIIDDNYDYTEYSKWWKDYLLNWDSTIQKLSDPIDFNNGLKFLRPTADSKAFTGAVYDEEKWNNTKKAYLDDVSYSQFSSDTLIQVSSVKNIQKEIRLWIVNKTVITGSIYQLNGRFHTNPDIDPEATQFANKVIARGNLADAWVLDVCLSNGEWKVMEAGCINHAGFYKADLQKLVIAIEDHYDYFV